MPERASLDSFFAPKSVAVVGATPNEDKGGYGIIFNMVDSFQGPVYPINPGHEEILGVKCYPSLRDVKGKVEMAIVFVPAAKVPEVLEDAVEASVKAAVIESGGFAEVGEEGKRLSDRVKEISDRSGLRVWGPNCTGLVNTDPFIFTPFVPVRRGRERLKPGCLGIIAQSGMLAAGFLIQYVVSGFFEVSKACAIGNKLDVNEVEVLRYMENDPNTCAVVAYLESIVDGHAFLEVARGMWGRMPLAVIKGGKYKESAQAALSHTASLAGVDEIIDGALHQAGVIRLDDFHDLMNLGKAFSLHPEPFKLATPEGNNIAIITITGGAGVVTIDMVRSAGLQIAKLEDKTLKNLAKVFPDWMPPHNPVDIYPTLEQKGVGVFADVIHDVLADDHVDGVILLPFANRSMEFFPFDKVGKDMEKYGKAMVSWMFGDTRYFGHFEECLREFGVAAFSDIRSCVLAMEAYLQFSRTARSRESEKPRRGMKVASII
jgi:acetate---CoA ligase (ADP-forming)